MFNGGFVVVRLVFGNTVLLALSRWFLSFFVVPFTGAARKPQLSPWLVRVLSTEQRLSLGPRLRPRRLGSVLRVLKAQQG